jgi:serine acetyltransferase
VNVIRAALAVLRDLVIGDDWRMSAGVVIVLAVAAGVHAAGIAAWWVLPAGVVMLLWLGVSGSKHRISLKPPS